VISMKRPKSKTFQDPSKRTPVLEKRMNALQRQLEDKSSTLTCLDRLFVPGAVALSLDRFLETIVEAILDSYRDSGATGVRLAYEGRIFRTKEFKRAARPFSIKLRIFGREAGFLELHFAALRPERKLLLTGFKRMKRGCRSCLIMPPTPIISMT